MLSLSLAPGWASTQAQKVTASGEGSGGSTMTQDQVKQVALADAKRMALEQLGTQVLSETEVQNFELIKDNIKTFAQGLVKVLKITAQTCKYEDSVKAMHCTVTIDAEVQLAEAHDVITRIDKQGPDYIHTVVDSVEQEQRPQSQGDLSFTFNVLPFTPTDSANPRGLYISAGSTQKFLHQELTENGILKSGDEFQIRFTPSHDAYVYLLNVDTHNQVYPMLPNPQGMSDNRLKGGRSYTLPAEGKYYKLDDKTGLETIYLLAAHQPMSDVKYIVDKAQQAIDSGTTTSQLAGLLQASTVKSRGISGITSGTTANYQLVQGVNVQDVEEVVRGNGAVVRRFTFQHQ
ncbi:MAG: DUF4384 domain-containing protein [Candidatus Sericytochromatia bacterium]